MLVRQQPSAGSGKLRWGPFSALLHFLQLQERCLHTSFANLEKPHQCSAASEVMAMHSISYSYLPMQSLRKKSS